MKKFIPTKPYVKPSNIQEFGKYEYIKKSSLVQKLLMFPNLGESFIIKNKYDTSVSYIIDKVELIGSRTGRIFGLKVKDGIKSNKITEVYAPNQYKIESIGGVGIQNGNIYDIKDMHYKITEKRRLIKERKEFLDSLAAAAAAGNDSSSNDNINKLNNEDKKI